MTITNPTAVRSAGGAPGDPLYHDLIAVDLDASYPTGGYLTFSTTVQGIIGKGRTVLGIKQVNFPGATKHFAEYDEANDKLKMLIYTTAIEAAGSADLSDHVGVKLLITSK